ncbi:serine/threonine-protein kinase [Adlercreutzia sp. R21]|uniref:serine/threonine protein kinase n=1 Tax=Adlercreutzia wanghongyangiae TaxID=3111451 RepID=UPI002DBDCC8B|nr:serine/threonine-protein kinase [Adlercreutzia sp. R21]MEC4184792.1 serine/threonine-protein kinase [Adlercreutzia sp. R21]
MEHSFGTMDAMENDPLSTYLDALARDDCYRVERVLKEGTCETTEVVFFVGANTAALGPFVRKRISGEARLGSAYGLLWQAQREGRRYRHLPRIYDVHERDGDLIVVMEYVVGRTLRDEVYERDASLPLARRLFPAICDGASELHEGFAPPLIHRDLKPGNVLVNGDNVTIIDFGITRAFRAEAVRDTAHFGTRSYAPPEQFGYGQTDVRSDVYALGMLLYYLLTERDPDPQVAVGGFSDPDVPGVLRPVLQRACAFDPAARFQSVRELKAAFLVAVEPLPREAATIGAEAAPMAAPAVTTPGLASAGPVPGVAVSTTTAAAVASCSAAFSSGTGPATSALPRVPSGRFASRVRAAFSSMSSAEMAGLVWDAVVLALWLFFALILATLPFSPDDQYCAWPLWLRMVLYWAFGYPFFTGLFFVLADVRVVRRAVPENWLLHGLRLRVAGAALVIIGVLSVGVSMLVAQGMGLPT